jgi:hypothetical protein
MIKRRLISLLTLVLFTVVVANLLAAKKPVLTSEEAVEDFIKLETSGWWLVPDATHWDQLTNYLSDVPPVPGPSPDPFVTTRFPVGVVKSYRVVRCAPNRPCSQGLVQVDYKTWGSINQFLHFFWAQNADRHFATQANPVDESTYELVSYTDKYMYVESAKGRTGFA